MRSVAFVSLGCAKNLVDTEVMMAKLGAAGWRLESEAKDADAVVINTCAFIDPAKAESTETIMEHAAAKRAGQQLVVAGCLAQRYGAQLQALVPEIDAVVGTGSYAGIVELIEDAFGGQRPMRLEFEPEPEHDFLPRLITTPRATAYLKLRRAATIRVRSASSRRYAVNSAAEARNRSSPKRARWPLPAPKS